MLVSYACTLGNAGNRTAVAELNGRNVGYGYDNDYRLSSEAITGDPAGNNGTVTYNTYDNVGNRMMVTSTLNAVPGGSFSYDANFEYLGGCPHLVVLDFVPGNKNPAYVSESRYVPRRAGTATSGS